MPHYYFDLVDDETVHDMKGVTLRGIAEAREYAKTFASELMETKSTLLGESLSQWSVRVSDGKFRRIMTIPFTSLVAGYEKK